MSVTFGITFLCVVLAALYVCFWTLYQLHRESCFQKKGSGTDRTVSFRRFPEFCFFVNSEMGGLRVL